LSITLDLSRASTPSSKAPVNLSGLTRAGLRQALDRRRHLPAGQGEDARLAGLALDPPLRRHRLRAMSNIAKETRPNWRPAFTLARPEIVERQVSKDGTRKWLIRTAPGIEIEAVYIPDVGRAGALCVSSQVGCTLNCTFCHTGTQKLVRNLTAAEIVAQVQVAATTWRNGRRRQGRPPPVQHRLHGHGRAALQSGPVADAIDIISDNEGIALSRRRITVSTSGVVPQLEALGDPHPGHAGDQPARHQRRPARRAGAAEQEVRPRTADGRHPRLSGPLSNARRVTFEYVMLKGVNDSPDEARALVKLIEGIPAKVNLIPFNPWPGTDYECSDWKTIEVFAAILNKAGYASPIRTPRGRDILAACGQLKSESEKLRASALRKAEQTTVEAA
jgi:23S rRNA (adenine2503-C2)-methyltransferase